MSGAILYIAIVAIWAFVLIPRWLRRPHLLGADNAEPDELGGADAVEDFRDQESDWAHAEPAQPPRQPQYYSGVAPLPRSRMLQARRRLLTMLVILTIATAVCTALRLTPWWICVPPAGTLAMYLLLLREAAHADAEQAQWRQAVAQRAHADCQLARAERRERSAQVIDISDRLGDQLYDQYADATVRAVGD